MKTSEKNGCKVTGIGSLGRCIWAALLIGTTAGSCTTAPALSPVCVPFYTSPEEASGFPEIEFAASEGTLRALLFAADGQFHANEKARILWKMTDGRGDIHLTAIHEDGTQIRPSYGPISRQIRSEWKHPGQEWGTEFVFPKAGCWRILVSRWLMDTDRPVTGQIEIQVRP